MTETSKKWRVKKNNKKRVINKIHNIALSSTTGLMFVFFLLSLCAMDNVNKNVILIFFISGIWLSLFVYANEGR